MYIQELWRYPVKSMRGEQVVEVKLDRTGIEGDRQIIVVSERLDRIITARTHPNLLGLRASISEDGTTLIEGHMWNSSAALALTRNAVGESIRLVDAGTRAERFDVLPLLVATDGAVRELDLDLRRLRPNIVIGDVLGHAERSWPGASLLSGTIVIDVAHLRSRCVMTTFEPDTLKQDLEVLRKIVREVEGKLALDCSVASPGVLHLNDPIVLHPNSKGHSS